VLNCNKANISEVIKMGGGKERKKEKKKKES
jgi:hypothetical protein